ncbi:MAG: T9SS type A sorting domain-containing protein [Bacteroidota bacterium]
MKNLKKMRLFSIIGFLTIIGHLNVNSQIIYTDVDPDAVIKNTYSYVLDINNDGTNDYEFLQLSYGTDHMAEISSFNNNQGLSDIAPLVINFNDTISSSLTTWNVFSYNYLAQTSGPGNWSEVTDKYLGLRINISGQWYYGWARLDVAISGSSITLKDYAFESSHDQAILAGDIGTTGIETLMNNPVPFSYLFNKTLCIDLMTDNPSDAKLIIYNTNCQNIKEVELINRRTNVDVNNFQNGIYILKIYNGHETHSMKIFIID